MARLAFGQGMYRQTCFHAHLAVEKALKALLLVRRDTYPQTRSLESLLAFDTSDELREWEEVCQRLSRFYLATRYVDALPDGVIDEISDKDARTSLSDAENVVGTIRSRVTGQP